jgi:hypothetical protein
VATNGPDGESDGRVPRESSAPFRGVKHAEAQGGLARARALIALGGIVAGLASFGIGEATSELIPADTVHFKFFAEKRERVSRDTARVALRTAAVAFGALGVSLGVSLGIAAGLARHSGSAATVGGLLGAVTGGLVGAGVALGFLPLSLAMRSQFPNTDLINGMLTHGVVWGPLGAVAGLAFAIGLGQPRLIGRAVASGFAGAVLGSVAFDLIGAFAFPLAKTDSPLARTWVPRLIARALVSVGTAAGVALLLPAPRPARSAPL